MGVGGRVFNDNRVQVGRAIRRQRHSVTSVGDAHETPRDSTARDGPLGSGGRAAHTPRHLLSTTGEVQALKADVLSAARSGDGR